MRVYVSQMGVGRRQRGSNEKMEGREKCCEKQLKIFKKGVYGEMDKNSFSRVVRVEIMLL